MTAVAISRTAPLAAIIPPPATVLSPDNRIQQILLMSREMLPKDAHGTGSA